MQSPWVLQRFLTVGNITDHELQRITAVTKLLLFIYLPFVIL